jgi:hypothetical protein
MGEEKECASLPAVERERGDSTMNHLPVYYRHAALHSMTQHSSHVCWNFSEKSGNRQAVVSHVFRGGHC